MASVVAAPKMAAVTGAGAPFTSRSRRSPATFASSKLSSSSSSSSPSFSPSSTVAIFLQRRRRHHHRALPSSSSSSSVAAAAAANVAAAAAKNGSASTAAGDEDGEESAANADAADAPNEAEAAATPESSSTSTSVLNSTPTPQANASKTIEVTEEAAAAAAVAASSPGVTDPDPADAPDPDAEERAALVRRLLGLAAASSRGQQDTREGRAAMEDLVTNLEFMNPTEEPARHVDGAWVLVYANVEAFRSSPFFWSFQKALPGGEELAAQIFKFTAGLPVAGTRGPFGTIAQTISLETGELVSEVEMKVFDPFFAVASGVSGTVVSTAHVRVGRSGSASAGAGAGDGDGDGDGDWAGDGDGDTLVVTPRTTRVRNSNVGGPLLDLLVVPTSDALTALWEAGNTLRRAPAGGAAGGAVEAEVTVTYVDETLRIMRVGEERDQVFVYARRSEIF